MKKNERKQEIDKLIKDYHKDNAFIQRQKAKWLPPPERTQNEKTPEEIRNIRDLQRRRQRGNC